MMYKINFILLFGLLLTLSSTLHGAQGSSTTEDDGKESSDNSPQRDANKVNKTNTHGNCVSLDSSRATHATIYPVTYLDNTAAIVLNLHYIPIYNIYIALPTNYIPNYAQYSKMYIISTQNQTLNVKTIDISPSTPQSTLQPSPKASQVAHRQQEPRLPPLNVCKEDRGRKNYYVWHCTSIQSCKALSTIITCLRYRQECENRGELKNILHYLSRKDSYRGLIGAYHHLLSVHLSHTSTEDAYDYISQKLRNELNCTSLVACNSYIRNQKARSKEPYPDSDMEYIYIRDLLDTIHVYLVHGYDSGHRYIKKDKAAKVAQYPKDEQKDAYKNDSEDIYGLVDHEMKALQKWQASIKPLPLTQNKQHKFQTRISEIKYDLPDSTMNLTLLQAKFGTDRLFKLWMQYILTHEYDTDGVLEQMEDSSRSVLYACFTLGNKDKIILCDKIKQYIQESRISKKNKPRKTGLYRFGLLFYYWRYYKTSTQADRYHHPGIPHKDLYVHPAHGSFKNELLAKGISIKQWDQKNYEAKMMLSLSPTLKAIKAHQHSFCSQSHTYLFKKQHILSVLFYTNFRSLYADFSSSFRYLSQSECLQDVKKRNAKWHFLSKYLRETVEVFGQRIGLDAKHKTTYQESFYHGFPYVFFNDARLSFYGPLSTSKQLAVATLFADKEGLVVALESCKGWYKQRLKCFNVSLISCFGVEDERLFIGGRYPLAIASIRLLKQCINIQPLLHTLHIVHKMILGAKAEGIQVFASDISIFKKLLSHSPHLPRYIQEVWHTFRHQQKSIKINIGHMHTYYSRFIPLLCSSDPQYSNVLLLDKLVTIFPNLTEVLCSFADNNRVSRQIRRYSSSIVRWSNFAKGIKDALTRLKQNKRSKLQQIRITTHPNKIKADCKLYPTELAELGWHIQRKSYKDKWGYTHMNSQIILTKLAASKCVSSKK